MKTESTNFNQEYIATMASYDEIVATFKQHRNIFPHVRTDYIKRMIQANKCFINNGVVITFNKYLRNNKIGLTVIAPKGSICIKQIATQNPGNGKTTQELENFLSLWDPNSVCFLSVRENNHRAIKFYNKNGFCESGSIEWNSKSSANGKISGIVFSRKCGKDYSL